MNDIGLQIAAARHAKGITWDEVTEQTYISRHALYH